MNTTYPVLIVIAVALTASMWAGSGMTGLYAGQQGPDIEGSGEVEDLANDSAAKDGVDGSASDADDGDIVSLILAGLGPIVDIAGLVVKMSSWLGQLGMPMWAAQPLGYGGTILASIGILQWAANRYYE